MLYHGTAQTETKHVVMQIIIQQQNCIKENI